MNLSSTSSDASQDLQHLPAENEAIRRELHQYLVAIVEEARAQGMKLVCFIYIGFVFLAFLLRC